MLLQLAMQFYILGMNLGPAVLSAAALIRRDRFFRGESESVGGVEEELAALIFAAEMHQKLITDGKEITSNSIFALANWVWNICWDLRQTER